ncbi:MAG: RIP metalloprotease RseP [Bacillota bacterium]
MSTLLSTIISFIVVLSILVFFHELGHFMIAKWSDVRVEEFAIGMGPKLLGTEYGETVYSLRALPLGGYCKLTGEMPLGDEVDEEEKEIYLEAKRNNNCFFQKSVWKRIAVVIMGPIMNFLLAALLFATIFGVYGQPVNTMEEATIGRVFPQQPAYKAGIEEGDQVLEIDGQRVNSWEDLAGKINENPQEEIKLKIKRNNKTMNIKLTPKLDEKSGRGLIGIAPVVKRKKVPFLKSVWLGIQQTGLYIYAIAIGLWQMVTAQISAQVSGPVEIAKMVGRASNTGMLRLLELAALISVNLGFMNLLPIPALDGGRLVFLGVEVVRGKPIDPEKEGTAHMVGFALLILLLLVVTVKDIFM